MRQKHFANCSPLTTGVNAHTSPQLPSRSGEEQNALATKIHTNIEQSVM